MNCKQCIHYEPFLNDEEEVEDDGRCKRHPPVIFVFEGMLNSDCPPVHEEQSCGEWSGKQ